MGDREPRRRRGARGWIIVDAGDYLEVAQEKRRFLEDKVAKIRVTAVLYTHAHYAIGAKARQDENTRFYGHDYLVETLRGDQGVSLLSGTWYKTVNISSENS